MITLHEFPVLPFAAGAVAFSLLLNLWSWRYRQEAGAKRWVWGSSILLGAIMLLSFAQLARLSGPLRFATIVVAGAMMLAGAWLGASRVHISNNSERNAWWSGFLQGLVLSLFILIAVTLILSHITSK
ncbi:MAG: hypothetical protein NZ520_07445 [bacterium]|nr:hypothetical protein [bacterium]